MTVSESALEVVVAAFDVSERLEQGREEVAFVAKREREAQELYRERMKELESL